VESLKAFCYNGIMTNAKPRFYFLLVLLAIMVILAFFILRPFLYSLILAAVFAILFQPLYTRILKMTRNRAWLATIFTLLIVFIFILIPIFFLTFQIFQEAQQLYFSLADNLSQESLTSILQDLTSRLQSFSPMFSNISLDINQYLENILNFLVGNLGIVFSNIFRIIASFFVFAIALFYLLKDGDKFNQLIIKFSPLTKEDDEIIIKKITSSINSIIRGSLMVAIIQGIVSSFGFIIFGVPNPILWGTLASIGALIPGVGTSLVLIPAIIFLLLTQQSLAALGLLLWGVLAVGLIDNLLGPKLVGKKTHLHPLIILFSVLGGISFFGPIGFILGPLVIGILFVLLEIYSTIIVKQ